MLFTFSYSFKSEMDPDVCFLKLTAASVVKPAAVLVQREFWREQISSCLATVSQDVWTAIWMHNLEIMGIDIETLR